MKLSNEAYDVLAWIGKLLLPSLAVLYGTIGKIWNLPFTEQIPLTITAIDVFLNTLLGISSANYYKAEAKKKNEKIAQKFPDSFLVKIEGKNVRRIQ